MGVLKLLAEITGLLALSAAARVVATHRAGRPYTLPAATFLVVLAVGAASGVAGLGVSGKRAADAYRDSRQLVDEQRVTAGAAKVSATLANRGADGALAPVGGAPTWVAFVEWARRRIPAGDTFEPLLSRRARESQVGFWLNWRLSPRTAVVARADADWLVVMDRRPPAGLSQTALTSFRPGYDLVEMTSAG